MKEAYIYDVVKTPRGRGHAEKGALKDVRPVELLKTVFDAVKNRNQLDTSLVEEVVIGTNTVTGEQGANIAKIASLYANWNSVGNGVTVSSFCTSGLEAIQTAAMKIMIGSCSCAVAGGVESMSRVPMFSDNGPWFADKEVSKKTGFIHMGLAADIVANIERFSKQELDDYALSSHQNSSLAWQKGLFDSFTIKVEKESGVLLEKDELIRNNLSIEKMAALPPLFENTKFDKARAFIQSALKLDDFKSLHSVGTSPGISDAASLLLLGNKEIGLQNGWKPIARLSGFASTAVNPMIMLTGVVDATQKLLANKNLKIEDIDLFEVNESFAAVPLKFKKTFNLNGNQVNINGGAIAMGHPLGATGGILVGTLLSNLREKGMKRGIATICAGAGIAQSTLVEIID